MYQAVIFDLDGTVLNTLEDLADAVNAALMTMNLPKESIDSVREKVGNGKFKLAERVLKNKGPQADMDTFMRYYDAYYEAHKTDKTVPYPHIQEELTKLKEKGIKLGIITNKSENYATEMISDYYLGLFDQVIGGDAGRKSKPDPSSLLEMIESFGLKKEDVLYVGDSSVDIETARNAGVDVCSVTWGFRSEEELRNNHPDYLIRHAEELERIVLC